MFKEFVLQATKLDPVSILLAKQTAPTLPVLPIILLNITIHAVSAHGDAQIKAAMITANHQASGWCHLPNRHILGHGMTDHVLLIILTGSSSLSMDHKISVISSRWQSDSTNTWQSWSAASLCGDRLLGVVWSRSLVPWVQSFWVFRVSILDAMCFVLSRRLLSSLC